VGGLDREPKVKYYISVKEVRNMTKKEKLGRLYAKWEIAKQKIEQFTGDEIMKSYAEGWTMGLITAIRILEEK
jgi:hypothetical protein